MWNDRYAIEDFVFGTAPSQFLVARQDYLESGMTALAVADGEGRNSVFMARKGLRVTAMEAAPNAIAKGRKLARAHHVEVEFVEADIFDWDWDATQYDVVAGIFFQFMGPEDRATVFDGMKRAVAPGGLLMIHGYTPKQLEYGTGGPGVAENLYTEDLLAEAVAGWEVLCLESYETELDEGAGHSGMSALIDLIARKPG
ncbi:class I SAM-dependent methyltransferase [Maritimibacter sp. UBA3975]|uniref:SAM-dependent methyltransferase n=1 Tax=Maritimibacter sp. UBA3975 TaxID=1946833 RepID=UPI000C0B9305|nr:class I SAM-dependent methyltransferase [Maritimibacter sp. UBA3975]MAM60922.1 SAM-dependent methyltransferase [Maritimibacter sp.]|tara:strand:+ start:4589 stop:5185 length:597 start_codon:yes stop_codon:yes gene_type:complete